MSADPTPLHPEEPVDPQLESALRAALRHRADSVPIAGDGLAHIRARLADQTPSRSARRGLTPILAGVAAAAVVVGVAVVPQVLSSSTQDDAASAAAARRSSTALDSDPTPVSTSAAATATTDGQAVDPTSAAPPRSSPNTGAPANAVPTTIPAGFRLPHEGDAGWVTASGDVRICSSAPVAPPGASDQRHLQIQSSSEDGQLEVLVVFPTAKQAVSYEAALQAAASTCAPADGRSSATAALSGSFASGFAWWDFPTAASASGATSTADSAAPGPPGASYVLVARKGSAVAITGGSGEWASAGTAADPAAVTYYRGPLDALAEQMCVFTMAGC